MSACKHAAGSRKKVCLPTSCGSPTAARPLALHGEDGYRGNAQGVTPGNFLLLIVTFMLSAKTVLKAERLRSEQAIRILLINLNAGAGSIRPIQRVI